jgi:NAD(P)-dependent dehydrogenase (short-subunit alcohol dehydrogenase family)
MEIKHRAVSANPFSGLRVAVTGGTSGLGLALVQELLHRGAQVAFVARSRDRVERVARENHGAHGIVGDVSRKEDIHPIALQIAGELGGLDVLINNASDLGPTPLMLLGDTECEDLERALATNLLGPFRLTKAVLGALGAGIAFLILFVAIEARSRERAMMPLSLYRSRNFSATNTVTLLLYFALGGALYFLPFGLIRLGGYSATQAGAALLPFALVMGFGASLAGALSDRFGPRLSMTAGPIIAACGLTLLAFVDFRESYWTGVFPAICVLAIGMTITVPPLTSTVMSSVGEARAGIASGVNNAVARVAGLFAVAALGAVLFASFSHYIIAPPAHANEALNAVLVGEAGVDKSVIAAFDRALRTVMLIAALSAVLGGVVGWLWIRPIGSEKAR